MARTTTMTQALIARIQREAGVPNLVEILAERLLPSDFQSLMLEVYSRSSSKISPSRLLEQYEHNRFVAPSLADPRLLVEVDRLAWQLLPDRYVPLELAPLCPLGTNSVVASVSQKKVVSAGRGTEVVADSTNVLALECAVRRRSMIRGNDAREAVLLAASHRLTRAQAFKGPRVWAHFRILSLCAAGRDDECTGERSAHAVAADDMTGRVRADPCRHRERDEGEAGGERPHPEDVLQVERAEQEEAEDRTGRGEHEEEAAADGAIR